MFFTHINPLLNNHALVVLDVREQSDKTQNVGLKEYFWTNNTSSMNYRIDKL